MPRQIPSTSVNLFQLIYVLIREYTERSGQSALNLSLGNPDGIPPESLRELKAKYAKLSDFDCHTYAEDRDLNRFVEGMLKTHIGYTLADFPHLRALPTAGIKTASALIPLACALHKRRDTFTLASNVPAYDIIGTWGEQYLGGKRIVWPLSVEDGMRLNVKRLREAVGSAKLDLIFTIRPGNPASVRATREDWEALIEYAIEKKARLVNDAAYVGLSGSAHASLFSVAKDHPTLEWAELYSVSKSFNDPGARLGAIAGTADFIEDFRLIKGNTDSGPNPGVMMAYGEYFAQPGTAQHDLELLHSMYQKRLGYLIPTLKRFGFRPACDTDAGFFTLWKVPKRVLGVEVNGDSEKFNRLVIEKTGIVGVHFPNSLIRYAVCTDVLAPSFQKRFETELAKLEIQYE